MSTTPGTEGALCNNFLNTRLLQGHLFGKDFKASTQPAAPYILVSPNTIPLSEKLKGDTDQGLDLEF